MRGHSWIRRMAAVLVAIAIAGCGAAASPMPAVTDEPPPTTSATAPATSVPSAAAEGEAAAGKLTMTFPEEDSVEAAAERAGCFMALGTVEVGDPRIAGEYRSVICWGEAEGTFSGVWTVWNDGGTWHGPFHGTIDADQNHVLDSLMFGSGDYAGLGLRTHHTAGADDSTWDFGYELADAASPPPASTTPGLGVTAVTGTRSCSETVIGAAETRTAGVTQRRGEIGLCEWSVSDERLAGPGLVHISLDTRADGSATGWGSLAQHAGNGVWLGSYTLEQAADGMTTVRTLLEGFDAYAGLRYTDIQTGQGDTWDVTGSITGAD